MSKHPSDSHYNRNADNRAENANQAKAGSSESRKSLPFEPTGKAKSKKSTRSESAERGGSTRGPTARKKASGGSADADQATPAVVEEETGISAKVKAQAEEILVGNRRKARDKPPQKEGKGKRSGREGRVSSRTSGGSVSQSSGAIPPEVSRRMLRRMAVFSGAPVFLGVGIFFLAYYVQSQELIELPPVAVLLVTMGCFGLGVLGLTYGVMSASWDSEPGSLIGLSEFKLNFGRVRESRREAKASKASKT